MNFENLCQICQEKSAPYKCPKCRLKYCSLTCYRDSLHQKCSKEFDEDEIIDSMNIDDENGSASSATTTNDFVRQRIEDIMKRKLDEKDFHNENDNDEDDQQMDELFEHLLPSQESNTYRQGPDDDNEEEEDAEDEGEERVGSDDEPLPDLPDDTDESEQNVNQLWDYLTTEEKREFKAMLTDGRISHLLNDYKPWKPWWLHKAQAPALITDLENTTTTTGSSQTPALPDTVPSIASNIIPLPSLTSILPHVHVRFDLFEILFGYVLISIRYRGDFNSYIAEAGSEFLHISSRHFTHKPDVFDEEPDPVSTLQTRLSLLREHLQDQNLSYHISEEFFVNLLADILTVIHGPYPHQTPSNIYVLAALSDLKRFLIQIQDYKPSTESAIQDESVKGPSTPLNVFHTNRKVNPKLNRNRSDNSKLCVHLPAKISKASEAKKSTKSKPFSSKLIHSVIRKIDYFLSWTLTHSNRLVMLEYELEQIEHHHRQRLSQYQREKTRIEKNLQHIRLQQQTTNNPTKRIQEL